MVLPREPAPLDVLHNYHVAGLPRLTMVEIAGRLAAECWAETPGQPPILSADIRGDLVCQLENGGDLTVSGEWLESLTHVIEAHRDELLKAMRGRA